MSQKLNLPNMLAYTGSIIPSRFVMFAVDSDGVEQAVMVERETVKGVIADEAADRKTDPVGRPNPHRVEVAYLPSGSDTLRIKGTVKFIDASLSPETCNDPEASGMLSDFMKLFVDQGGMAELAKRYAMNLVNGRILWRNGYSKKITVLVESDDKSFSHVFDASAMPRRSLDATVLADNDKEPFETMVSLIEKGLTGQDGPMILHVTATAYQGDGQRVYPSEEFVEGKKDSKDGSLNKVLAKTHTGQAVMHSQKIGNAIRTIDDWHKVDDYASPIAVEPYGVDQSRQFPLRHSSGGKAPSFYALVKGTKFSALLEDILSDNSCFVAACLVRGGVYGAESAKKKKGE